jgi:peptidyl-prolyl cis-trans isomerase SurA
MLGVFTVNAQKDKALFTIDGEQISVSEFQRVFEKNLTIVSDDSQKDIDNYLDLYINYKLKLKEAYDLKMDTIPSYKREFEKYKNQLILPYLKDENTEKDLVREAYERLQKEINASHILIRINKGATPKDTLAAYTKIKKARERVLNGEAFEKVAKEMSEDPSARQNGGNLGYFTVFQMVYPFETVAYTTPVGEVSKPFKTRFGYHILKVNNSRKARGEVEVAHIMLKGITPKNETKIKTIKNELEKGADFENLAKQYSQDGSSAKRGGKLPKFGSGRMVKEFEEVAFSLKNEGAISNPFKTAYGWHIVKLLKKYPIESFEQMQGELRKKVEQGKRAKIIGNSIEKKLLNEYGYSVNNTLLKAFESNNWNNNIDLKSDISFLRIQDKVIPVKDFYKFYLKNNKQGLTKALRTFKAKESVKYYKEHLTEKFPELGYTLKEYEEGLLLFDLMQKKIWEKAEKDSLGLMSYFNSNANKYQWRERYKTKIITCNDKKDAKKAYSLLKNKTPFDKIESLLSKESLSNSKEGVFEKTAGVFPKNFDFKVGISQPVKVGEQYVVISIDEIIPPQPKKLKEVRGKVISDYQDYIEKQWINELKKKYTVVINTNNFAKLAKTYKD